MPSRSPSLLSSPPGTKSASDEPGRKTAKSSVFLFVILTAQLMVVLDTTIVNVALPHIQAGLHFSDGALSWVLSAYILTFGGLLLLGARTGDLLGQRRTFLFGIALFSASSMLGGFAVVGWMLLASRAIQGIGAALAAPSALSLLTKMFPDGAERVRAIGLYTTVSAAGGATGLVAGGLLTELVSWRWVMFVNVPIGLAVLVVGSRVIAESPRRSGRFDLVGALTSTLGMTGVVLGLVEAGADGWGATATLAPLVAGAILLAVFVLNESRVEEPILPLRLFAHAGRTTANAARGLVYAGMYGMFFFLSQFLQDIEHYSPLLAGVAFLPMPASVFLSSQFTSRVLVRRLPQKSVMLLGGALATIGLLFALTMHQGVGYYDVLVSLVLVGCGSGISFVSLTSASLSDVAPADAGVASGLVNVSQQLGAAVGLAVLVSVFATVTHHLQIGTQTGARAIAQADALFVHGLHEVFAVGALFGFAALGLVAVFVRRPAPVALPARERVYEEIDAEEAMADLAELGGAA